MAGSTHTQLLAGNGNRGEKEGVSDSEGLALPLPGWKCAHGTEGHRDQVRHLCCITAAKGEQTSWALERGTGEGPRELLLENDRGRSFEVIGLGAEVRRAACDEEEGKKEWPKRSQQ